MEPRRVIVDTEGEGSAKMNGAKGEHDDADKIADDDTGNGGQDHKNFLPKVVKGKKGVEAGDHEQGGERANTAARIGDIDGKGRSGAGRRKDRGAIQDVGDADH